MTTNSASDISSRWRIVPGWQSIQLGNDELLMVHEDRVIRLSRAESALLQDVAGGAVNVQDGRIAERLRSVGIISNLLPSWTDPREEAYWGNTSGPSTEALAWLPLTQAAQTSIGVLLESANIEVRDDARVLLVTTDDYLRPEIAELAKREVRPWLLARPVGKTLWLGPLFVPDQSVCWHCLAHWLRTRRYLQASLTGWASDACPPQRAFSATAATATLAAGLISTTIASLLASGGIPSLRDTVLVLDTQQLTWSRARVPRRAECECKPPTQVSMSLVDWANPVCGLVTNLRVTPRKSLGLFHASCTYFQPLPRNGTRPLLEPGYAFGSDGEPTSARDRCIAEALERYSSVWHGNEASVIARWGDLQGAIDPRELLQFSEQQYRTRDEWNAGTSDWYRVPKALSPETSMEWVRISGVASEESAWAPAAWCYLWYDSQPSGWAIADSNGCAAGRTPVEATLNALLELIERDAVAIWWYNSLQRPKVRVEEFADPTLVEIFESLRREGREPVLLDLTNDIGVPVYAAVAARPDGSEPFFGTAAHPDPSIAAHKAAGELARSWFFCQNSRPVASLARWLQNGNTLRHRFLTPAGAAIVRKVAVCHDPAVLLDDVVARVAAVGIGTYVLDLTRPEIGLPVSRVIAPGLRHPWRRLGPGRLYTVPVKLGWLERPLAEDELNPEPCPV